MTKSNPRFLLLFVLAAQLVTALRCNSQTDRDAAHVGYPIPVQRLQLKLTTSFVYFHLRRSLDLDSAAILVSKGEHLPYSLYYDEDYRDGANNQIKELLAKGSGYLFKSGSYKEDLDRALPFFISARSLADKSRDVYWQNAVLSALGRYYLQSREFEKSKECFTQAVDLARKANNTLILTRALANRGSNSAFNDPQKEVDLTEALELSRRKQDKVQEIEMLTRIYEIYFVRQKYDTVKKQLLHVTELEKAMGYKHIHYNHNVLSFLNQMLLDFKNAFAECKTSLKIMEENGDVVFSNFFYGTMANIYVDYRNYDAAQKWIEKSMEAEAVNLSKRIWYPQFIDFILNAAKASHFERSLALTQKTIREYPPVSNHDKMCVAHVLGYCYQRMNQWDSTAKYYAVMLPYMDSIGDDQASRGQLFSAYVDLARYHLSGNNPILFEKNFRQAKNYLDSSDVFQLRRMHWMQYKHDSVSGNYLNALEEFRQVDILDDTLFNQQTTAAILGLHVEYEVENKDKSIELLVEKDKTQQAIVAQSRLTRNVTFVGILVMIGISGLLYNQYRNKQKSNQEMDRKNVQLEQLVKDKEWLVKEIHHRVKNNLQIVSSLLRTQAAHLEKGDALDAINESQLRMQVISLLHQKLYKVDTDSNIDLKIYIPELVNCIRESSNDEGQIGFDVRVDDIHLDISQAVPVGLFLNEAITNAIKYAYPKGRRGIIHVYLLDQGGGKILLGVADEGRGLPADFDRNNLTSLGMKLMDTLAEQLEGKLELKSIGGTSLEVAFVFRDIASQEPVLRPEKMN